MSNGPTRKPRRKKKRSGWIVGGILLVLLIVVALLSSGGGEGEGIEVTIDTVERRSIVEQVIAPGLIEPETQVVVSSEVSGEIVFLGVEEGDHVNKGDLLVRIDPEAIVAQLEQSEAQILSAKSRSESARASLLKAESELERLRRLYEKDLVTEQEFESAETQVQVAKAEHQAALYSVQQAEASYKQVKESVNKTTIRSPISGVVTRLNVKVGENVVGAIQMTGTEIMTVADLSVIESVVDVVETDVVGVDEGDKATIEVDALPDARFSGVVTRIANSPVTSALGGENQLTSFKVRLRVLDPDDRLRPGMTATATIVTQSADDVVSVPILAVTTRESETKARKREPQETGTDEVRDLRLDERSGDDAKEEQTVVFVVHGDSVEQRNVKTGLRDDQFIQVTSGLKEGEVVVSGNYPAVSQELSDGAMIRRKKPGRFGDQEDE